MEGPHRTLTSSHGWGGLHGTPGPRLLSDAPGEPRVAATSRPWMGTGRGLPRGDDRHDSAPRRPAGRSAPVLGGHRRLLKLSCSIPTSLGHCECQAWRGLGTASLPAPGAIFGADPLSWVQTHRSREGRAGAGAGAIPGDDTRASDTQKPGRGTERSCWSRGGGRGRQCGCIWHRDPPAHPTAGALPYCWSHMMRWKRYL